MEVGESTKAAVSLPSTGFLALLATVLGLVGTLLGLLSTAQGIWNKQAQQKLEERQKATEASQKSYDALSKVNADAWPYLEKILQPDTPPSDRLGLAMSFPESGYERARSILAGVKTLKDGREMGAIEQAKTLLDTLKIQINTQRIESSARDQGFRDLQKEALRHLQMRNLNKQELAKLPGNSILGFLASREEKVTWLRNQLTDASGPLFKSGDLNALILQGLQLAEQAQLAENRKLVTKAFIETIEGAARKSRQVLGKIDTADDHKSLNRLALELLDIYDEIAPTISKSNNLSSLMIDKCDALISVAGQALNILDQGRHLPRSLRDRFEQAYSEAIDSILHRLGGEQIQGYKDRVNFIHSVIEILDSRA